MFKDLYLIAGIIGILSLVFVWVLISIGLIYKQQDTNKIEKILSTSGTIFALFILWRVFVTSGDLGILLLIGSVVSFTLMILGYFIDQSKKIFRAARGWFIPFFLIFVVRNFLYEPYQIPSESMVPGLQVGDFILVEKFTYGLKIDRTSSPFALADTPEYGDVVVFIPPHDPRPFVKRLVGKPGDKITIIDDRYILNNKEISREKIQVIECFDAAYQRQTQCTLYTERLGSKTFISQNMESRRDKIMKIEQLPEVPSGFYFVMGDNRDNSADSRYWGFVPEEHFVGTAAYIFMSWKCWLCLPSFSRSGVIQ